MPHPHSGSRRPLVFGEALFDLFPDGHSVLGGAPFNVAWHLRGFGLDPLFISRVGRDSEGEEVRDRMREWGMDLSGLQWDETWPTGRVRVEFIEGEPQYTIAADQAYDRIDQVAALEAARNLQSALLYHGTLALRGKFSREALQALRDGLSLETLVDLNLRDPWWDPVSARSTAEAASCVKLNLEELRHFASKSEKESPAEDLAQTYRKRWDVDLLVLTRGSEGAVIADKRRTLSFPADNPSKLVDPVGAGDAFTAVLVLGLLEHWPLEICMKRAGSFAALICGLRGAIPEKREPYDMHLDAWRREAI